MKSVVIGTKMRVGHVNRIREMFTLEKFVARKGESEGNGTRGVDFMHLSIFQLPITLCLLC